MNEQTQRKIGILIGDAAAGVFRIRGLLRDMPMTFNQAGSLDAALTRIDKLLEQIEVEVTGE